VPSAHDYATGSCHGGPLRGEIEQRDAGGLERATQAVAEAVARRFGAGAFGAQSQALVVTAARG
jgi:hypothetical protein